MSTPRSMSARDWGTLLLLAMLWGGSFFFIELALTGFAPFTLVFLRVAIAALVLCGVLALRRQGLPRAPRVWGALLVMALLNSVIPWSLFSTAQQAIPSGLASILNATTPLWGVAAAHFLTVDEKATPNRLLGLAFGFAGVVAMIGVDALAGLGSNIVPQLACLGATFSYGLASVYGRRFREMGLSPLATAAGQLMMAALVLAPLAALTDMPWRAPAPPMIAVLAVAALALLSTALAFVLFFRLLANTGAVNSQLVTFLIPVTAILLGSLVLGETLAAQHFLGMALIALGLVAIDGRLPRRAWAAIRPSAA